MSNPAPVKWTLSVGGGLSSAKIPTDLSYTGLETSLPDVKYDVVIPREEPVIFPNLRLGFDHYYVAGKTASLGFGVNATGGVGSLGTNGGNAFWQASLELEPLALGLALARHARLGIAAVGAGRYTGSFAGKFEGFFEFGAGGAIEGIFFPTLKASDVGIALRAGLYGLDNSRGFDWNLVYDVSLNLLWSW